VFLPFRYLDEATTSGLMTMADAVAACEAVLAEMGRGLASLSQPPAMFLGGAPELPTHFKVKGGYLPTLGACGFRVVGDVGEDGREGEHHFCYLLDPRTAMPVALVAQTRLHRMRTAACGLIALKHLVGRDRPTVALVGAGRIAAEVVAGFAHVFPGGRLIVASRQAASAEALVSSHGTPGAEIVAAASAREAVVQADAILTLTSSRSPVIDPEDFRAGMTICGMGEHGELPPALFRQADRFVVDDLGFAKVLGSVSSWIRACEIDEAEIDRHPRVPLGEIVAGTAAGRTDADQRILAIVQGLAIADLAIAKACLDKTIAAQEPEPARPLGAKQ
jgi:ornithine cyclodeaminase/alanine dehydrogenase-like protein (mu-crystallin family)